MMLSTDLITLSQWSSMAKLSKRKWLSKQASPVRIKQKFFSEYRKNSVTLQPNLFSCWRSDFVGIRFAFVYRSPCHQLHVDVSDSFGVKGRISAKYVSPPS
jgi:hypothetical protein